MRLITPDNTDTPTDIALANIVRRFYMARILVVGDVILDRYVTGTAQRLSPEAPIPVLRPTGTRNVMGGAANVALNIASLGGHVVLMGVIGKDDHGKTLERLASENPNIHSVFFPVPKRPTTTKTRFMSGPHQILRLDEEVTTPLDQPLADKLLDLFDQELTNADVVILSDYAKGVLCDYVLKGIMDRAKDCGCIMIADPKRADFQAYRGATILTPNEHEVQTATQINAETNDGAEQAGLAALKMVDCEAMLVTRSSKGMTLVRDGFPVMHLPTRAKEVADVSGAGDTLVATLAVALCAGSPLPEAAMLANIGAGIAVGKQGTSVVTKQEILDTLHLREIVATDLRIANVDEAVLLITQWKAKGLKVGFTNGCFDLIHPGHVRLLNEAKQNCDRLVVALNTDASVKRLKGQSRPVQNETSRATVMASMAPVDLVVLFDEDTPLEIITMLQPQVLVKGSDYKINQVVGADLVQGWGGKVVLVDLQEGHSTTNTIKKMATVNYPRA